LQPRAESAGQSQQNHAATKKEGKMFLILAVVLVLLWVGSFTVLHITGFAIHLLLIFAVISIIGHFLTGRRAA
jgi:hypothetical protein